MKKRFSKYLQCGEDMEIHFVYKVNDEPTDLAEGDNLIIAIYSINNRCLFTGSLEDGKIIHGPNVGEYILSMTFEDNVNMPDKTIMEIVIKDYEGKVKHTKDDVMLYWNNNKINDLVR